MFQVLTKKKIWKKTKGWAWQDTVTSGNYPTSSLGQAKTKAEFFYKWEQVNKQENDRVGCIN